MWADANESSYMRMPVESCGISMLGLMRWTEEKAIGKKSKNQHKNTI